jgi:hypothetical protein
MTAAVSYDDPVVRRIVGAMKACHRAVENVVSSLPHTEGTNDEEE